MLPTSSLDYSLPEELIATTPSSPRDAARLMVLRRSDPTFLQHRHIRDLPELLSPGDLLVLNTTHVLPARFRCIRADTGGEGEGLFLSETGATTRRDGGSGAVVKGETLSWHILLKLRRAKPGAIINLLSNTNTRSGVWLRLIEPAPSESSEHAGTDGWFAAVEYDRTWPPATTTKDILDRVGRTPLPPYILASRKRHEQPIDDPRDRDTYQTVFAAPDEQESHGRGSVAAPTAGLHLTPELLAALAARGIDRAEVTLHVGMGTFKPVETEFVEGHPMHSEWCRVPRDTALALQGCAHSHQSVIALGTTTARTLESFTSTDEMLSTPSKNTRILITPGHHFRHIGALMTNFHLPRSTLLAMVAAFLDDTDYARGRGLPRLLEAYRVAVAERYRFYSFGDAMLILP